MAYLRNSDDAPGNVVVTLDMIDMLVTAAELTAQHMALPDGNKNGPTLKAMIVKLNGQINEDMHKLGLEDLYEVRQRLELNVRNVINARKKANEAFQNVIAARI